MKIVKVFASITLVVIVILLSGCTPGTGAKNSSNAIITEGVMATAVNNDSKPTGAPVTSFAEDTPAIYCSFKIAGAVPEDMIKASWYYVKGEAEGHENELLNETFTIAVSDTPSYYLAFYLDKPVSGWYSGDYKVVMSVNNVEKLTVPFSIK